MDLSRLEVTEFDNNNKNNEVINMSEKKDSNFLVIADP